MRLGKRLKKSRGWKKASDNVENINAEHESLPPIQPKHITAETVIGRVSLDLVSSYFAPKINERIEESLERYAEQVMTYQEALIEWQNSNTTAETNTEQVELQADGSTIVSQVPTTSSLPYPQEPIRPLFHSQYQMEEIAEIFQETSNHFFADKGGWRIPANAAKFERMLDEKYGPFRPFITQHPEIEIFLRNLQRKYAAGYFSPFRQQEKPPIPRTTAIVLLFMMQRGKMRIEIIILAALFFLVGLQPWALVALVSVLKLWVHQRKHKPIGTMKRHIPAIPPYYHPPPHTEQEQPKSDDNVSTEQYKQTLLLEPVGTPWNETYAIDVDKYDVILLGTGPGTLFTGALLARAGRKVWVLSSNADASGCLTFQTIPSKAEFKSQLQNLPFDVESDSNMIPKISRQQQLLAPALSTLNDYQGGIRFAKVGSEADNYAFEVLSIPGVGTEKRDHHIPWVITAGGVYSLMDDAANYLGDNFPPVDGTRGDSFTGQFVALCESMNATASAFYISKTIPSESVLAQWRGGGSEGGAYQKAALGTSAHFLNACFPTNAHARSLMAGIGMKGENLRPGSTSMAACVTNVCNTIHPDGMHYPIGGPRALCRALANVIERNGGRVTTEAHVLELIFDESLQKKPTRRSKNPDDNVPAPYCVGVILANGKEIRFAPDRYKQEPPNCPLVVSNEGLIQTFIRYLPDGIRTQYKVPRGIPALAERRPVVHILFALKGSADDLSVTGADYYRLPGAAIARDEIDSSTGEVKYGEMGYPDDSDSVAVVAGENIVDNTNQDSSAAGDTSKTSDARKHKKKSNVKFQSGFSWIHISFPSAKDPSFEQRHGKITTCVVTIEADDELVTAYDTKPKIFVIKKLTAASGGEMQRLFDRVVKDLLQLYPQLEGKILHSELRGPFQKGLSHTPERYAAKGVRADTPYPCLYVGGSDLTVGDSFSGATIGGWLVANAVCGYSVIDHLFLQKNITSDLEQFLEPPQLTSEEDVAVPFTPRQNQSAVGETS
jgi:hypothetical protein